MFLALWPALLACSFFGGMLQGVLGVGMAGGEGCAVSGARCAAPDHAPPPHPRMHARPRLLTLPPPLLVLVLVLVLLLLLQLLLVLLVLLVLVLVLHVATCARGGRGGMGVGGWGGWGLWSLLGGDCKLRTECLVHRVPLVVLACDAWFWRECAAPQQLIRPCARARCMVQRRPASGSEPMQLVRSPCVSPRWHRRGRPPGRCCGMQARVARAETDGHCR